MNDLFEFWGCGKGVLKLIQPHIRILSGIFVGCAALLIPVQTVYDISIVIIVSVVWIALAAIPLRIQIRIAMGAAILFLPYLLLSPWIIVDPLLPTPLPQRFLQTGKIILRSVSMLYITVSTVGTLTIHEFYYGLKLLPIPRVLTVLILQIVNQTGILTEETIRIIRVLRLRGASGQKGMRVLFSFPVVWMVRLLFRAERTAAAMTIRGYGIENLEKDTPVALSAADFLTVFLTSALLIMSVYLFIRVYI